MESALPVRLYYPVEGAAQSVIAHFQYAPDESWSIFGDLSRGPHGLVISRMEILPEETSSGVTAGLLRKVPIGEVLSAVRAKAAWESARREGTRALLGQEPVPGLFDEGDEKSPGRRGGRAPMTDALLREVAMAYLRETAPGAAPGAVKRMAEHFGRPAETIRTWITRARRDGWLGPSTKGRAGAEPGARLIDWLGRAMMSTEAISEEADAIAQEWGITTRGQRKAALVAYEDPAERDLSHRMGLPPLEAAIAAQAQYGQALSAELSDRSHQVGASEGAAFEELAAEMRQAFADHRRT